MVAIGRRRQLPPLFDSREMGRRFKRALDDAGWAVQEDAVEAIRGACPGTTFAAGDLSALVQGYKMPQPDRLITIGYILGLDIRILFPELFDESGTAIRRGTHPEEFLSGWRLLP
jgi:hypothetical protein